MPKTKWIYLNDLQDYQGTIEGAIKLLAKYKRQYGGRAIIRLNAGYNNVSVEVEQRAKEKRDGTK